MIVAVVYPALYPCTMLDNNEEKEQIFSIAIALLASELKGNAVERHCMDLKSHVQRLQRERPFSHFYRMSFHSFQKLLTLFVSVTTSESP